MIGNLEMSFWKQRFDRSNSQLVNNFQSTNAKLKNSEVQILSAKSESIQIKVKFSQRVTVVLIPQVIEYKEANLITEIWWTHPECLEFKDLALKEVRVFREDGLKREFWWQTPEFVFFRQSLALTKKIAEETPPLTSLKKPLVFDDVDLSNTFIGAMLNGDGGTVTAKVNDPEETYPLCEEVP